MISRDPEKSGQHILRTELWLPQPIEEVFAFFADAYQLEEITPPWLHFHVLTPRPIEMKAGAFIEYKLRMHGIPVRWKTEISAWEPPHRFVDEQVKGPYHHWHHEHRFTEKDGGTLMEDVVHYKIFLGFILHPLFIKRDLEQIFHYRQEKMKEIFLANQSSETD